MFYFDCAVVCYADGSQWTDRKRITQNLQREAIGV